MVLTRTEVASTPTNVDSLYGPGTVAAWYLTLVACIISWTLHPEKRKQDTINADLVVSLTLPVVAVCNLLSQISKIPEYDENNPQLNDHSEVRQRMADTIEAPLVLIEAFMNVAVVMFMIAAWFIAIRRALVVGVVGLLCFAADWYVNISRVHLTGLSRLFSRNFVADSAIALLTIGMVLGLLLLTAITMAVFFLYDPHQEHKRDLHRLTSENRRLEHQIEAQIEAGFGTFEGHLMSLRSQRFKQETWKEVWQTRATTSLTLLFLPLSFFASILSTTTVAFKPPWTTSTYHTSSSRFLHQHSAPGIRKWLFPRSASTLGDLDQEAALVGGIITVAFSLYSVCTIWVKGWLETQRCERQTREQENIRLRRILLEGQRISVEE